MRFRRWVKTFGILIIVLVAVCAGYVARTWDRVYAYPLPDNVRQQ